MSRSSKRQPQSAVPGEKAGAADSTARRMPDSRKELGGLSSHRQAADVPPQLAQLQEYAQLMAQGSGVVVQKFDYPPDSMGSFNRPMATETYEDSDEEVELSDADLQRFIIEIAQELQGADTGGFRLGTFGFDPDVALPRIADPKPEGHGMQPLPGDFDTTELDSFMWTASSISDRARSAFTRIAGAARYSST